MKGLSIARITKQNVIVNESYRTRKHDKDFGKISNKEAIVLEDEKQVQGFVNEDGSLFDM